MNCRRARSYTLNHVTKGTKKEPSMGGTSTTAKVLACGDTKHIFNNPEGQGGGGV